jgi:hypothetical protein
MVGRMRKQRNFTLPDDVYEPYSRVVGNMSRDIEQHMRRKLGRQCR